MKKVMITVALCAASLFATTGAEVYTQKCAACHQMKGMMDIQMRAPAMPMVSKRLKMKYKTEAEFVAFVSDYIQNPSQKKGMCMPMAYKRFGTMPPIGKGLTQEEREAVASWLFTNFKGSWGDSMESKSCEMRNKPTKKPTMKCGMGKCGTVKIPTH